jgi:hypothetical protein
MSLLEEYEQRQSGVRRICEMLELRLEEQTRFCLIPQDTDVLRDAMKTQWYRAQVATLKKVLDEIQEQGDTGEDAEGIGEAALPPSQQ